MRAPEEWPEPFRGFMAWAMVGGACLWGVIAFTVFHLLIAVHEMRYERGSWRMQEALVRVLRPGWRP